MIRSDRHRRRVLEAGLVVVVLAGVSTVGLAAATGAFHSHLDAPDGTCTAPHQSGTVVDVQLMDMGGRMPMMGGGASGPMRILTSRRTVPAGTVSLRVANVGSLVHEVVVLPLAAGATAGERPVGADDRVDEAGSAGEASRRCGAGAGEGIDPGTLGWVTLHLAAGDYELVCNLPGHYAAGMYATLHVA